MKQIQQLQQQEHDNKLRQLELKYQNQHTVQQQMQQLQQQEHDQQIRQLNVKHQHELHAQVSNNNTIQSELKACKQQLTSMEEIIEKQRQHRSMSTDALTRHSHRLMEDSKKLKQELEDCREEYRRSLSSVEIQRIKCLTMTLEYDEWSEEEVALKERVHRAERVVLRAAETIEKNEETIHSLSDQLEAARKERDYTREDVGTSARIEIESLRVELHGALELLRTKDLQTSPKRQWQDRRMWEIEQSQKERSQRERQTTLHHSLSMSVPLSSTCFPSFPPRRIDPLLCDVFGEHSTRGISAIDGEELAEERINSRDDQQHEKLPPLVVDAVQNVFSTSRGERPEQQNQDRVVTDPMHRSMGGVENGITSCTFKGTKKKKGSGRRKKNSGKFNYVKNSYDLF